MPLESSLFRSSTPLVLNSDITVPVVAQDFSLSSFSSVFGSRIESMDAGGGWVSSGSSQGYKWFYYWGVKCHREGRIINLAATGKRGKKSEMLSACLSDSLLFFCPHSWPEEITPRRRWSKKFKRLGSFYFPTSSMQIRTAEPVLEQSLLFSDFKQNLFSRKLIKLGEQGTGAVIWGVIKLQRMSLSKMWVSED